jgi:hypothetical protein
VYVCACSGGCESSRHQPGAVGAVGDGAQEPRGQLPPCWVGRTDDPTAATGRRAHENARPDGGFLAGAMQGALRLTTGACGGRIAPSALTVPFRFDRKPCGNTKCRRKSRGGPRLTERARGLPAKHTPTGQGQCNLLTDCVLPWELPVRSPNGGVPDRWHGIRAAGSAFCPPAATEGGPYGARRSMPSNLTAIPQPVHVRGGG